MKRPDAVHRIVIALKRYAPEAETILYGSEARGDARRDSDIDLLVLLPDNMSQSAFATRKLEITDRLFDVEMDCNVNISPLIVTRGMWDRMKTPFTVNVLNDGIRLL